MPVLVRVQGPDAPPDAEGEGVGRLDVALPAGVGGGGGGGAQQLLGVLEVGGIGNFPLAQGAFPEGSVGVDRHRREMRGIFKSYCLSDRAAFPWMEMPESLPSDVLHWGSLDLIL